MKLQRGFTLIELMVAVVVIGILTVIAIPAYNNYVLRGQLTEAFSNLSSMQMNMEQFYQDNRSYATAGACGVPNPVGTNFTFSCVAGACAGTSCQSYTATATGNVGAMTAGFVYTIDQTTTKQTTAAAAGWAAATMPANCWIRRNGGVC